MNVSEGHTYIAVYRYRPNYHYEWLIKFPPFARSLPLFAPFSRSPTRVIKSPVYQSASSLIFFHILNLRFLLHFV